MGADTPPKLPVEFPKSATGRPGRGFPGRGNEGALHEHTRLSAPHRPPGRVNRRTRPRRLGLRSHFQPKASKVTHFGFVQTEVTWLHKSRKEGTSTLFLSRLRK